MPAARRLRSVPDQPGRAVLYVRVSALMGRGGDDFHSPDLQLDAMRNAIGRAGLREVAVVEDIDRTGQNFEREGIDKIRRMVEAGQVDVVALYDLSRLGRDLLESLTFIKWLRERGVTVMSSKEHIDDSPEGQFMLGQFLGWAQLYGQQIGRRWAELIQKRARAGHQHGSVPLGYRRVPVDPTDPRKGKKVIHDPVVGPAMTEAFTMYADDRPISKIASYVAGIRGKPTAITTVKACLGNPFYRGKVALWNQGRHRIRRWWTTIPLFLGDGQHEALVDEQTWERVQERLRRDTRTVPRHLNPSHSMVGIVFCARCDHHLQRHMHKRDGGPRFECGYRRPVVANGCDGIGRPLVQQVEDVVLARIASMVADLRADASAHATHQARTARGRSDAEVVRRELSSIRGEMAKLTKGWQRGIVPDAVFEENMAELKAAERSLADRLDQATDRQDALPPRQLMEVAERLLTLWPRMDTDEKNRVLKRIVRKIVVRGAERYREPVEERVSVEFW